MQNPRSSTEHVRACLLGLHASFGHVADEKFRTVLRRYEVELMQFEPATIEEVCKTAAIEFDKFPPLGKLLKMAREIRSSHALPAPMDDRREIAWAVNIAFSFLAAGHLRELDRLLPPERADIVQAMGEMFRPYWREAVRAEWDNDREDEQRYRDMVTMFVESRLGKSLQAIMETEIANRRKIKPVGTLKPVTWQ